VGDLRSVDADHLREHRGPGQIAVIDARTRVLRGPIPINATGPHGLAIVADRSGASLWCAADAGGSSSSSATPQCDRYAATPGQSDVIMYDRDLARIYVAVGSPGTVSAFDVKSRRLLETVVTEEGAHTIGWDPATRRLFVFQPKSCGVAIYQETA